MTDKDTLADNNIKDLHDSPKYVYCDLCAMNGYANEKVSVEFEGFRSEYEDGFIYKFTVYDYYYPAREHIHKCNLKLIDELVGLPLKQTEVTAS
jgi:hypothetical protein